MKGITAPQHTRAGRLKKAMHRFNSFDEKEYVSPPLQIQRRDETLARFGIATGGQLALTEVAPVVTIGKPSCDIPKVSLLDRLTAQCTE
jgi:hypothetical protein